MGGKDVIYLKQLQSSNLEPAEVQNLLKQLADDEFSKHESEASVSGSGKKVKVCPIKVSVIIRGGNMGGSISFVTKF